MSTVTFVARLREDGSLTIPAETMEALGLQPGDALKVRLEKNGVQNDPVPLDEDALREKVYRLFEAADHLERTPGPPLGDEHEAAWGQGVEEKHRKMGIKI